MRTPILLLSICLLILPQSPLHAAPEKNAPVESEAKKTTKKSAKRKLPNVAKKKAKPKRKLASKSKKPNACYYIVRKNDSLSKILYKLGHYPIWGKTGAIADTKALNRDAILKRGHLIYPGARLRLPGTAVGVDEQCLEIASKRLPAEEAADKKEAEQAVRSGQHAIPCPELETFAREHQQVASRQYLLHLAALCYYENANLARAAILWEELKAQPLEHDLEFKVNYNLAIVYCQGAKPSMGYAYLRQAATHAFQNELEWNRREFLELVGFCTGKVGGERAQREAFTYLAEKAKSETVQAEARERLARLERPRHPWGRFLLGPAYVHHARSASEAVSGDVITLPVDWNPILLRYGWFSLESLIGFEVLKNSGGQFFIGGEAGLLLGVYPTESLEIALGTLMRYWSGWLSRESAVAAYGSLGWRWGGKALVDRASIAYTPTINTSTAHEIRLLLGISF